MSRGFKGGITKGSKASPEKIALFTDVPNGSKKDKSNAIFKFMKSGVLLSVSNKIL